MNEMKEQPQHMTPREHENKTENADKTIKGQISTEKLSRKADEAHVVVLESILDGMVLRCEKNLDRDVSNEDNDSSDWSSDEDDDVVPSKRNHSSAVKKNAENEDFLIKKRVIDEDDRRTSTKSSAENESVPKSKNEIVPVSSTDFNFEMKDSDRIHESGVIISVVQGPVIVVKGSLDGDPLRNGTVLCTEDREVIGIVDELFGPVNMPHYILRRVKKLDVKEGTRVFSVERTRVVLDARTRLMLQQERGSDASNVDDEEVQNKEFSDDETERQHKRKQHRSKGLDKRKRSSPALRGSSGPSRRHHNRHRANNFVPIRGPSPNYPYAAHYRPAPMGTYSYNLHTPMSLSQQHAYTYPPRPQQMSTRSHGAMNMYHQIPLAHQQARHSSYMRVGDHHLGSSSNTSYHHPYSYQQQVPPRHMLYQQPPPQYHHPMYDYRQNGHGRGPRVPSDERNASTYQTGPSSYPRNRTG